MFIETKNVSKVNLWPDSNEDNTFDRFCRTQRDKTGRKCYLHLNQAINNYERKIRLDFSKNTFTTYPKL